MVKAQEKAATRRIVPAKKVCLVCILDSFQGLTTSKIASILPALSFYETNGNHSSRIIESILRRKGSPQAPNHLPLALQLCLAGVRGLYKFAGFSSWVYIHPAMSTLRYGR